MYVCLGAGLGWHGNGKELLPDYPSRGALPAVCVRAHVHGSVSIVCCLFLFLKTQFKWHLFQEVLSSTLAKSVSPPLLSEHF